MMREGEYRTNSGTGLTEYAYILECLSTPTF
jgi:hypothetical protein